MNIRVGLVGIYNLVKAFNAFPEVISEHIQPLVLSKDGGGAFHSEAYVNVPDSCRLSHVGL